MTFVYATYFGLLSSGSKMGTLIDVNMAWLSQWLSRQPGPARFYHRTCANWSLAIHPAPTKFVNKSLPMTTILPTLHTRMPLRSPPRSPPYTSPPTTPPTRPRSKLTKVDSKLSITLPPLPTSSSPPSPTTNALQSDECEKGGSNESTSNERKWETKITPTLSSSDPPSEGNHLAKVKAKLYYRLGEGGPGIIREVMAFLGRWQKKK